MQYWNRTWWQGGIQYLIAFIKWDGVHYAGAVKAVQHLLNEIGYVGTKISDKSEDLAAVAMEMTPEEVQWLKVLLNFNSLCTFSFSLISLPLPPPLSLRVLLPSLWICMIRSSSWMDVEQLRYTLHNRIHAACMNQIL